MFFWVYFLSKVSIHRQSEAQLPGSFSFPSSLLPIPLLLPDSTMAIPWYLQPIFLQSFAHSGRLLIQQNFQNFLEASLVFSTWNGWLACANISNLSASFCVAFAECRKTVAPQIPLPQAHHPLGQCRACLSPQKTHLHHSGRHSQHLPHQCMSETHTDSHIADHNGFSIQA